AAGGSPAALRQQAVAAAAHRLDRVPSERPVDLLAEPADVDGDDVRPVVVGHVPGVPEQLVPGEHLPRPAHEELEQRELLARELDLHTAAPDPPGCRIEPEV